MVERGVDRILYECLYLYISECRHICSALKEPEEPIRKNFPLVTRSSFCI